MESLTFKFAIAPTVLGDSDDLGRLVGTSEGYLGVRHISAHESHILLIQYQKPTRFG